MGWLQRQRELKLDILASLARSQRALARMLESAADSGGMESGPLTDEGEGGVESGRRLRELEALVRCQTTITAKTLGIRIGVIRKSPPRRPWLNERHAVFRAKAANKPNGTSKRGQAAPEYLS